MEDHPLVESCCIAVISEALKPGAAGMIPAGPVPFSVTTSASCAVGIACAVAPAVQSRKKRETTQEKKQRGEMEEWNNRALSRLQGYKAMAEKTGTFVVLRGELWFSEG